MALTRLGLNQAINLATNVTGTLPVANGGTALTSGFVNGVANPGKINQVQSGIVTADQSTSSSSYVSNFSVDITPSATSSKVLVIAHTGALDTSTSGAEIDCSIYRDSTNLTNYTRGGAAGRFESANRSLGNMSINLVDSPNSTSALSYGFYYKSPSSHTVFLNNDTFISLILMEILA
jgi:hypothetical protein